MKKLITSGVLIAALGVPASAAAQDPAPTPSDFKNASKYCKDLKKRSGSANFATMFKNHGKCVSTTAKQQAREDAKQEQEAKSNASKQCKAERNDPKFAESHGGKTFNQFYGSGKSGKNAHGKCVSQKAKANKEEADKQDAQEQKNKLNAAKQCKKERSDNPTKFAADYGSRRNAFGKCVSSKAKAQNDGPAQ